MHELIKNELVKIINLKACLHGHYEILKMLLEAGALVELKDFYGQNTLHYAVKGWKIVNY